MLKTFSQLKAFFISNINKRIKTQINIFLLGGYFGSTNVKINCSCGNRDPACINIDIPANDRQRIVEGKICLPVIRSQPENKCTIIRIIQVV